jgi:hypothetical protein
MVRDDDAERIGLAFRPRDRPRRRDAVHIDGTLWLDAETAALRTLEFEYINPPLRQRGAWPGGQLTFEALPDGSWIVRSWWLRLPQPEIRRGPGTSAIVAVRWSRGRGLTVTPAPESPPSRRSKRTAYWNGRRNWARRFANDSGPWSTNWNSSQSYASAA